MNADVARILDRWTEDPDGERYLLSFYTVDELAAWLDRHHQRDWVIGVDRWDEVNNRTIYFGFAVWHSTHWEAHVHDSTSILSTLESLIIQIGTS